jgi:hypothetical protein
MVGRAGTAAGVTLFDAADAAPVPTALVAVTVEGVRGARWRGLPRLIEVQGAVQVPVNAPGGRGRRVARDGRAAI